MSHLYLGDHSNPDEKQLRASRQRKIGVLVLGIHILLLSSTLIWSLIDDWLRPPKVNAFRVKIGPKELSRAPLVGPPERTRPSASPQSAPAEPAVKIPKPEPRVKPRPKPEPKVTIPKKKPVHKRKVQPKRKANPRRQPKKVPKKRPDPANSVYRPPKGTNEFSPGGRNFNRNVPIGSRNRGQEKGKENFKTPGGGLSEEMTKFNERAGLYLKNIWIQPPKSLLGNTLPAVTIEVEIAADGRVLDKKILKTSGVTAMDESVQNLLRQLDRMPAPPKRTVVQFILQTED